MLPFKKAAFKSWSISIHPQHLLVHCPIHMPDLIALSVLTIHSVDFEEIRYEMDYVLL